MHLKAQRNQVVDDRLDLVFGRGILHGNDHRKAAACCLLRALASIGTLDIQPFDDENNLKIIS
jgi:hypothetical protein